MVSAPALETPILDVKAVDSMAHATGPWKARGAAGSTQECDHPEGSFLLFFFCFDPDLHPLPHPISLRDSQPRPHVRMNASAFELQVPC